MAEIPDELAIKIANTEKATHLVDVFGLRPVQDNLDFLGID